MKTMQELLTIKEASDWATQYTGKKITTSNISYLLQYGRVKKIGDNGNTQLLKEDLANYYKEQVKSREDDWKEKLGEDLNWDLSFEQYKESDTTKHVHRLHPYKGKFIPQLVEYFLDNHTDKFKKEVYFHSGDIVLDPFCGSGTTLVQSNELGINAIGVDISVFNSFISNIKLLDCDYKDLEKEIKKITKELKIFISNTNHIKFETELLEELNTFNKEYFPSPEIKIKVREKVINETNYSTEKVAKLMPVFDKLINKYNIEIKQNDTNNFLGKWYLKPVKDEIDLVFSLVKNIENKTTKKILSLILSRTIRSCRATTHADLATLIDPVTSIYYCSKHGKICKPLFSILSWWERYSKDTIKRFKEFENLKTKSFQHCLTGDSRNIDIIKELKKTKPEFAKIVEEKKIKGIFSSPPYVGLIDYHEQHAYAYALFGFERKDEYEIGSMKQGQTKLAKENYVKGIAEVLLNSKRFLVEDYDIFLVANDKNNLYPQIAELAGMKIVNQHKRPVLNRTEKDKTAYSEIIFHLKER